MLSLCFGCINALTLPLTDGDALLFGNRAKDFYEDVVYHVEYPLLPFWKLHHSGREVDDAEANAVLLEILQLVSDIHFVAAESV